MFFSVVLLVSLLLSTLFQVQAQTLQKRCGELLAGQTFVHLREIHHYEHLVLCKIHVLGNVVASTGVQLSEADLLSNYELGVLFAVRTVLKKNAPLSHDDRREALNVRVKECPRSCRKYLVVT